MTVLAFDSSLERSAWAVLCDGRAFWEARSFIKPRIKEWPDLRFHDWRLWAEMTLDQWKPEEVVYEKPTPRGGASGAPQIFLEMTLRELCAVRRIPVRSIYPASLKLHVAGHGHADKEAMMAEAAKRFPLYRADEDPGGDVADALGMLVWFRDGAPVPERKVKKRKARHLALAKDGVGEG